MSHGTVEILERHALDRASGEVDDPESHPNASPVPPMRTFFVLFVLLTSTSCGSTDPETVLFLSGTVVAASDGSGFAAGQGIDGAQVTLRYQPPLDLGSQIFDTDVSDLSGGWAVQTVPPRGQREPDCSTLSVSAVRAGFSSTTVRLSSFCGVGADDVTGIEIALTPN